MLKIFKSKEKIGTHIKYRLDSHNFYMYKHRPYVRLICLARYTPINVLLEDIVNNEDISESLCNKDIAYCNYLFGYMSAKDKMKIYKLQEIQINENKINFLDLESTETVTFTYANILSEEIFNKIDRADLRKIIETTLNQIPEKTTNNETIKCNTATNNLRLVK